MQEIQNNYEPFEVSDFGEGAMLALDVEANGMRLVKRSLQ